MEDLLNHTVAGSCFQDSRILEAKEQILKVIQEKQKQIECVRPAKSENKAAYEMLLGAISDLRGGKLYYPYIGSGFGNGSLVELLDGSVKYDFISGIGVHYFGHNHPRIIKAGLEAAITDTVMQGHLQQNWDSVHLMELLTRTAGMDHCFLSSSGAMANENGLKLAFQKKHPAHRLLAFEHCFMGRTTTLAHITDKPQYREGLPLTIQVDYIPFFDPEKPEESTAKAVERLKNHIQRHPKKHAAMCFELIQGEGGFNVGSSHFFSSLMQILKEEGIAILVDEVQSFGRTPSPFAFQYFGLEKYVDIVTIGKLSQICATLFHKEFAPRPGLLSQTFTAATSSIRAAIAIMDILLNEEYFGPDGRISHIHSAFASHLERIQSKKPDKIKGPWGIGCMTAFTPYCGESKRVVAFARRLFENGVISFIAGANANRIRFLPPALAIQDKDINNAMEIIEKTLDEC